MSNVLYYKNIIYYLDRIIQILLKSLVYGKEFSAAFCKPADNKE
jgi:hypothetical protein